MIVVKIELWPKGFKKHARPLGEMHLTNDFNTTLQNRNRGSYNVKVMRKNSSKPLREGRVENFPRKSYNIWRLISRALLQAFPEEQSMSKPEKLTPPQVPTNSGLCENCVEKDGNVCLLTEMITIHYKIANEHGTLHYEDIDPASWDEWSIDDPEIKNGAVTWCPMHSTE